MAKVPPQHFPAPKVVSPRSPTTQRRGHGHGPVHHDPHEAEHAARMAEALGWAPDSHAEAEERKADREDQRDAEERKQADPSQRVQVTAKAATPTTEAREGQAQPQKQQQAVKKDAFQAPAEAQGQPGKGGKVVTDFRQIAKLGAAEKLTAVKTTDAVREAQERALKSGKPPDAFTLLNAAQPHGVFFKEDDEREGSADAPEDPELAAAVEECIRLMFGVRGVLRIGPGRDQHDEPVIVIVVAQGFGEASMRAAPERVGRFTTLLALPYDVLPLKKER